MRKGSSKPCPGCGQIDQYRSADHVCDECRVRLDRAKFLEAELDRINSDKIEVFYGHHSSGYINAYSKEHAALLERAFQALAIAASSQGGSRSGYRRLERPLNVLEKMDGGANIYAFMDKGIAEAILNLHTLMGPSFRAAYQTGVEDGSNLLMRMAAGEISGNEFLKKRKGER